MKGYTVISLLGTDPALEPYRHLIYSSFLRSLRFGNDWFKDIESDLYYDVYHRVIDALLVRPESVVRLALLPDELDTCIGWSLSEEKTLHYVFVKGDIEARRHGIGTALLPKEFDKITHLTKIGRDIWKKKYPKVKFDPFIS